jgi:uncharacterized Fe-S center protein
MIDKRAGGDMSSNVYFMNMRATMKENLFKRLGKLLKTAGLPETVAERDLVAVKLHFGEMGNTAFIRPIFLREIVKKLKELGGIPFLTDANTLYAGTRGNSVNHLMTAIQNGFAYSVVDAPIIIADGLKGRSQSAITINQKHFRVAYVGSEIENADTLISVAHFKGHELSGFGGAIKNIGMGSASRHGKLEQHSGIEPKVKAKKCIGCGECIDRCSQHAISLQAEKAVIDGDACIGCGECIINCPQRAINVQFNKSIPDFMEKMVEYAYGVLKNKNNKVLFINFITDVTPACDCWPVSDAPIVRDVGIVASTDPVAIDQASVDLVNSEPALIDSRLRKNRESGEDKIQGLYPKVDWTIQLDYGAQIGLGSRQYEMIKI